MKKNTLKKIKHIVVESNMIHHFLTLKIIQRYFKSPPSFVDSRFLYMYFLHNLVENNVHIQGKMKRINNN